MENGGKECDLVRKVERGRVFVPRPVALDDTNKALLTGPLVTAQRAWWHEKRIMVEGTTITVVSIVWKLNDGKVGRAVLFQSSAWYWISNRTSFSAFRDR